MSRGQRRAFEMMMAFSIEKLSEGRPYMSHWRMATGSPRVTVRLKSSLHGMFAFRTRSIHVAIWS